MDSRQKRGLALAQEGRVKHVDGPLWFVPSERAGGYLVNVETGKCSCPDGAERCKHLHAVEIVRAAPIDSPQTSIAFPVAPPKAPAWPKGRRGDLLPQEQVNVRAALRYLRIRAGNWPKLAQAIGMTAHTTQSQARRKPATASLAVRLARLAGVGVDDVLCGRFPAPGNCPHCGRGPESAAT